MQAAKPMLMTLCVSACVLVYGYSAIDTTGGRAFSVSVDLSAPEAVVWPFEVAVVGDMGEPGLRLGPNVGAGWKGKAGGRASYRFYIPEEGRYHLWAYARWFDKCTNAVFASVDDGERAIVGNDPIFKQWHWVRGFAVPLRKGAHVLELSNHSDNISLQRTVFVNSATVVPDDCRTVFSDVFYDGFDGCHIGNFASWTIVSGEWEVKRPAAQHAYLENALVGRSKDSAMILYRGDHWSDYSFHVAVKRAPSQDAGQVVGFLFGVQDEEHLHRLRWKPIAGSDDVEMILTREAGGETELLATSTVACPPDVWHEVQVTLERRVVKVSLDGAEAMATPADRDITGGIGLCVEGQAIAYFDDVHVRTVTDATDHMPDSL